METALEARKPVTNVLEAIQPFEPDDGHKGTFLVLRIAGMERGTALRLIKRKYRSWQHWRIHDEFFRDVDDRLVEFHQRFGGQARIMRTALLDISVIETGIKVFGKILKDQPMSEGMWAYAVKMAGMRMPMMNAQQETSSPWERLASSINQTLTQREMVIRHELDGAQSIIAKETIVQPNIEQQRIVAEIVRGVVGNELE